MRDLTMPYYLRQVHGVRRPPWRHSPNQSPSQRANAHRESLTTTPKNQGTRAYLTGRRMPTTIDHQTTTDSHHLNHHPSTHYRAAFEQVAAVMAHRLQQASRSYPIAKHQSELFLSGRHTSDPLDHQQRQLTDPTRINVINTTAALFLNR